MRQREMQGFQRGDAHGMDHTGLQAFVQHGGGSGGVNGSAIPNMGGVIAPTPERQASPSNIYIDQTTGQPAQGGVSDAQYRLQSQTHASPERRNAMESALNSHYTPKTRISLTGAPLPGETMGHVDLPAGEASNPQFPNVSAAQVKSYGAPLMEQHNQLYAAQAKNAISPGQIVPNGQKALAGQFHASDLDQGQMASLSNTMQAIGPNAANYSAAQEAVKPRLGIDRQMAPGLPTRKNR